MSGGVVLGSFPPVGDEEWTTTEVCLNTGIDPKNLRRWARGKGIEPCGAEPHGGREMRWPALAVWEARRAGGCGNRTSGPIRSAAARRGWETRRASDQGSVTH